MKKRLFVLTVTLFTLLLVLFITACGRVTVQSFSFNEWGQLVVTLTDGRALNLGQVTDKSGDTAYEVYKNNFGFSGSEREWLQELDRGALTYHAVVVHTGGCTPPVLWVKNGELIPPIATPEKRGHVFLGWYIGEKPWDFATDRVTDDMQLHPRFEDDGVPSIITVSQSVAVDADALTVSAEKYTRGPEELVADEVLNACYERNRQVAMMLDVTVVYEETNLAPDEIGEHLDRMALMETSPVDLIINDVSAAVSAILKGQLYNLKSANEDNYFNFGHESWYTDYMEGLTYDPSRVYVLAGDYFLDVLRSTEVMYVNEVCFDRQLADRYRHTYEFYIMIYEGEFTYDELATLTAMGWKATSGETVAVPDDEIVGLWHHGFGGMVASLPLSMVEQSDGGYALSDNTEALRSVASLLCDIWQTEGAFSEPIGMSVHTGLRKFSNDGIVFLTGYTLGDIETAEMLATERKSPIVYPKPNAALPYCTSVRSTAELGYVLANAENFSLVSAYCQTLNEATRQRQILIDYAEMHTGFLHFNFDMPLIKNMLYLIRDSIGSSFTQYLAGYDLTDVIDRTTVLDANAPEKAVARYLDGLPAYRERLAADIAAFDANAK